MFYCLLIQVLALETLELFILPLLELLTEYKALHSHNLIQLQFSRLKREILSEDNFFEYQIKFEFENEVVKNTYIYEYLCEE